MKFWSLLIWVTQFGFSVTFPTCFFLLIANWFRNTYGLGVWVLALGSILGLLTTISTVRSCVRAMRKEADRVIGESTPSAAFNEHD